MKNINFYFIPSAHIGYKERSMLKILYALLFVRSQSSTKSEIVRFMTALSNEDPNLNFRLKLPQYFCSLVHKLVIKCQLPKYVRIFFAHLDCQVYRENIFCVMPMFYADTFTISNKGWGTQRSRTNIVVPEGSDKTERLVMHHLLNRHTKFPVKGRKSRKLEQNTILVALQLPWDQTITERSQTSWLKFLDIIYNLSVKNVSEQFRLRIHPLHSLSDQYLTSVRRLLELPNVALSENELFDELEHAKVVVLINSGVGFESLMFGRPVISFGDSIYKEFTYTGKIEMNYEISLTEMVEAAREGLIKFEENKTEFIRKNLYCVSDADKFWINKQESC